MKLEGCVYEEYLTGDTEAPCPGDSPDFRDFRPVRDGEEPNFYVIPYTLWGDYCGDIVGRANWIAFQDDYPHTFVDVRGSFFSHELVISVENLTADIREAIDGLESYFLYNEETLSLLEDDLAWEAWDRYLGDDVRRELASGWGIETDGWTDERWETVRHAYYRLTMERSSCPYAETATSIVFPYHQEVMADLADLVDAGEV